MLAIAILVIGIHGAWGAQNASISDYANETHYVTTEDGYILQMLRLSYGNYTGSEARKVVFVMHGLGAGSNCWTYAGPDIAIGYHLADAGFDVWFGNARGNEFSRSHVSLDPDTDKNEFFNFSWVEIAMYDLPAMFDYVLNVTQQDTFHYVAHSQGGTVYLVLNSLSTAYHSKIISANLLGGVGYEANFPNTAVTAFCVPYNVTYAGLILTSETELVPAAVYLPLVVILVGSTVPPEIYKGGAVKQLAHYCQNFVDGEFRGFKYDDATNELLYGSTTPPSYDLSKIPINTTFHYSVGDTTQGETDELAMANALPNARARRVARDTFAHLDYLLAQDSKELVSDYVIASIQNS